MRSILMASILFIAGSILVGCKTMGLKKSDRGGYAAFENDKQINAKITELESRLKKLEDNQKK